MDFSLSLPRSPGLHTISSVPNAILHQLRPDRGDESSPQRGTTPPDHLPIAAHLYWLTAGGQGSKGSGCTGEGGEGGDGGRGLAPNVRKKRMRGCGGRRELNKTDGPPVVRPDEEEETRGMKRRFACDRSGEV